MVKIHTLSRNFLKNQQKSQLNGILTKNARTDMPGVI
jgi:hypothetical protein